MSVKKFDLNLHVMLDEGVDPAQAQRMIVQLVSALKGVSRVYAFHRPDEPVEKPKPAPTSRKTPASRVPQDAARAMGFTGDMCGRCGQFTMKRAGTCLSCASCGNTTGCS